MNAIENKKNKPIQQAIKTRHVECLKILLAKNTRSPSEAREYTSIMLAIKNNQPDAVPLLLEAGEDPGKFTSQTIYIILYFNHVFIYISFMNALLNLHAFRNKLLLFRLFVIN